MPDTNTDTKEKETNNFLLRVVRAQEELKAPKGQYNKFGKYNYRSAEDILEAVKPINKKYGLLLTLSDQIEMIGSRYYLKATATLADAEGSEKLEVTAFAREPEIKKGMDDSQITGTASSYARKYALNGLYNIDDTKDADTDQYHEQTNQPNYNRQSRQMQNYGQQRQDYGQQMQNYGQAPAVPTRTELQALIDLAKQKGQGQAAICKVAHVNNVNDLTMSQYMNVFNRLQKIPDVEVVDLEL